MSKILNVQLSWTVQTSKPATGQYLNYDGYQTDQFSYQTILDASSDNSLSNKTDYAVATVAGATLGPVDYFDTVTLPAPASKYTNTENKWTTVYVPDDFTIPPSEVTPLTDGFAFTNAQHTGVSLNNLSYNVQTEVAGSLSLGGLQLSTSQNAKSALLGALSAAGLDNGTVTAIGNVATVTSALSKVQSDGLALAALGIKDFGSPKGVSFAQYDALVNAYLATSRDGLNKAVDGLVLSGNPQLDKLAHSVIESGRLIENLAGGDAVPFSASATFGLEVNFGGVLTISGSVTGTVNAEVVIGGGQGDTVTANASPSIIIGSRNDETIIAGSDMDFINAGGGNDRVILSNQFGYDYVDGGSGSTTVALPSALSAYSFTHVGNGYTENSPASLAYATLVNISRLSFIDGTVQLATSDPLFDPVFYDQTYRDVYRSGVAAEAHYAAYGTAEGRNPNALFSTVGYLFANQDVKRAGVNPLDHYDQYGWKEGRDPSAGFNTRLYLLQNPDVAAAGVDPLLHYMEYGRFEGRQAAPAIGQKLGPNGFDPEFYLLSNPDVAKSGVDPYQHYKQYGWREGRAPNAWFNPAYYNRNNPDVAAAGVDPLLHYDQYGWREGRNPSAAFDTALYLYHNRDVAAAGVDPLVHYLQYGVFEGRTAYAVPPTAALGALVSGNIAAGQPGTYVVTLQAGTRYDFSVADRGSQNSQAYVPSPVVSLIAADGTVVARGTDPSGRLSVGLGFTAQATGNYVISIEAASPGDAGRYDLTPKLASPNDSGIVTLGGGGSSLATAYDFGTLFPASGVTAGIAAGEYLPLDDIFKFSLQTPAQVEVDLLSVQRGMSLLDATGHVLAVQHAAGGHEQIVSSLDAGTYYVDLAKPPSSSPPGFSFLPAYVLQVFS